jgi:hypothetical protein
LHEAFAFVFAPQKGENLVDDVRLEVFMSVAKLGYLRLGLGFGWPGFSIFVCHFSCLLNAFLELAFII